MFLLRSRGSAIVRECLRPTSSPPADPRDLADATAYALCFQGRKRVHNADDGAHINSPRPDPAEPCSRGRRGKDERAEIYPESDSELHAFRNARIVKFACSAP